MNPNAEKNDTANPLLMLVSGLCPVLIPSFTLQNGIILGAGVALHAILLAVFVPLLIKLIGKELHFSVAVMLSAAIAAVYGAAVRLAFPYEYPGLSPFLALIALNCFGLSVLRGSLRQDSLERLPEYARSALYFLATLLLFSSVRELFGSGMITLYHAETAKWTLDLRNYLTVPLPILLLPAGAFLLLGYAIAARQFWSQTKGRRTA